MLAPPVKKPAARGPGGGWFSTTSCTLARCRASVKWRGRDDWWSKAESTAGGEALLPHHEAVRPTELENVAPSTLLLVSCFTQLKEVIRYTLRANQAR